MDYKNYDTKPSPIYLNGSVPKETEPIQHQEASRQLMELRSEEIDEVLSRRPAGIIRYGLTVVLFLGILVLIGSWFIKYPEIIRGSAIITTETPPFKIITKSSGRLQKLLVKPNQNLKQGDFLAEIENTTRLENLPVLQTLSKELKNYLENASSKVSFPSNGLTFGDLQAEYNKLYQNYQEAERLRNDAIYRQRKRILEQQISDYKKMIRINQRQVELNNEEFANVEIKYRADKKLYQEKVYAKLEFLNLENTYIQKKKERENYAKTLVENSLMLSEKQKALTELDFEIIQKLRVHQDNITQSVQNIDNLLANWQQNFVITAPTDGIISFLKDLNQNQVVRSGDTLFAVLPQNQPIIAVSIVPAQNFGKVSVGQSVIIKLSNFPFEEYGSLSGIIDKIEPTTLSNQYRVKINLDKGLTTNYKKVIPFNIEMQGSAEIITNDLRLIERVFYGLIKMLNQR